MFQLNSPFFFCHHRPPGKLRCTSTQDIESDDTSDEDLAADHPPPQPHHSNLEPPSIPTKMLKMLGHPDPPPPPLYGPAITRGAGPLPQWMRPS